MNESRFQQTNHGFTKLTAVRSEAGSWRRCKPGETFDGIVARVYGRDTFGIVPVGELNGLDGLTPGTTYAVGVNGDLTVSASGIAARAVNATTLLVANTSSTSGTVDVSGIDAAITAINQNLATIEARLTSKAENTVTLLGVNSVRGGGDLTDNRVFQLVNDQASPGNLKYYGTNSEGVKGWHGTVITGTLTNAGRLVKVQAAGVVQEALIADGVSAGVLTLAKAGTENRTWTVPDRSDTFAGLGAQTFTGDQVINANLGIGVTPGSRLQIEGNANLLTPTIGGNRIATVAIIDTANAPGCGGVLEFGSQTGKTFSAIKGAIHDGTNNTVGDLNFYTRNAIADAAMALRMTIAKTGEVGIGAGVIAGNGLLQLPSGTTKASGIAYGDTFQFRQSSGNIYQTGPAGADIVYAVQRSTGEVGYWQAGSGSCTFGTYSSTWLVLVTGGTAAILINPSQNVGIGAPPDAGQGLLQLPTSAGIPTSIKLGTGYLYQRSTFPSAVTWDAGSTTTAALFVEANANAVRGYMGISAVPKIYIGSQTNHAVDINTNNTTAITIDTAQGVTTTAANYLKTRSVVSAAGTTTLDATDATAILTGTTTQTFTLPAAAAGRRLFIKNRSTGALTVNRAGSDTIDGGTTLNVAAGTAKILIANGTDWCVWNA